MSVVCCSRAVGSRQNSPTDIETQAASSRLSDSVLLSQPQHSVQLQQQNVAGQFDAGLTSLSAPTNSFFTAQYMMDDAAGFNVTQAQADYSQQVGLHDITFIIC